MKFVYSLRLCRWLLVLTCFLSINVPSSSGKDITSKELQAGISLFEAKSYSNALMQLDEAVRHNPNDVAAHYYKALCFQYLNQMTLAQAEYAWVVKTGNPKFSGQASVGLQQLLQHINKRSYAGQGAIASSRMANNRPKIYDFYTTWCGPCKRLKPIFEEVEHEFSGKVDMQSLDAEAPSNAALVSEYRINAYPTIIFLDRTGRQVDRQEGLLPKEELVSKVQKLLGR